MAEEDIKDVEGVAEDIAKDGAENNITPSADTATETPTDKQATDAIPETGDAEKQADLDATEDIPESITLSELSYGDSEVSVEIPAEIVADTKAKGIDIEAVTKELYESKDFELSEDTLNKLYEAYPKWQVDAYIQGIKASNDTLLSTTISEREQTAKDEEEAWKETTEILGGEEVWDSLDAWASVNMSAQEIAEFNHVMQDGSLYLQKLMIKDLHSKFVEAGSPETTELGLEDGARGLDGDGKETKALSQMEYFKLLESGEYNKDPEKYDKLRRLGMRKGI